MALKKRVDIKSKYNGNNSRYIMSGWRHRIGGVGLSNDAVPLSVVLVSVTRIITGERVDVTH